ncbi:MAG: bifunctional enoyl-CoA hydratase/phosphate acetyltransferase [Treponema sp.]|jgi:phosphate butyryltransferase|nr:bifunctional enoyl-CoA hydratase/phosphate acetyltransferase [Treponema sp.]
MKTIAGIINTARGLADDSLRKPLRIAVAAADDPSVLAACAEAGTLGIADSILIGDLSAIKDHAERAGIDLTGFCTVDVPDRTRAVNLAIELVRDNKADLAMKGLVESATFLRTAFRKDMGLNTGKLISHVGVIESPFYHKLLFLSDGAVNIAPNLEQRVSIIENAVALARSMGIMQAKVALLAALEQVNPDKMPCTADAAIITQMYMRSGKTNCIVDGPLALDNALSGESAGIKKINSQVAGDADILITPTIEAGNILYKSLMYLGNARSAGIIMGARRPLILTSRAADTATRLASIALGVCCASRIK